MFLKKLTFIILFASAVVLVVPSFVFAAAATPAAATPASADSGDYLLKVLPAACINNGNCTLCDAVAIIVKVSDMVIEFSALIALVMIVFGGVILLTAMGNENRMKMGKQSVIHAFIGLFIVFIAWTIVNTIITGTVGATNGGFKTVTSFAGGDGDWTKCPSAGDVRVGADKEKFQNDSYYRGLDEARTDPYDTSDSFDLNLNEELDDPYADVNLTLPTPY
ncbi:MAG: pilin [Candidatus Buchananbacteria bacterium]